MSYDAAVLPIYRLHPLMPSCGRRPETPDDGCRLPLRGRPVARPPLRDTLRVSAITSGWLPTAPRLHQRPQLLSESSAGRTPCSGEFDRFTIIVLWNREAVCCKELYRQPVVCSMRSSPRCNTIAARLSASMWSRALADPALRKGVLWPRRVPPCTRPPTIRVHHAGVPCCRRCFRLPPPQPPATVSRRRCPPTRSRRQEPDQRQRFEQHRTKPCLRRLPSGRSTASASVLSSLTAFRAFRTPEGGQPETAAARSSYR